MSDVIIVGGACMGSSLAHHLKATDDSLEVVVVERDPSLARSSTLLSDGNVRVQFNLEENILISRYAIEVLERFGDTMTVGGVRPEVSMRRQGNLFLIDDESAAEARAGLDRQVALGCRARWMDVSEIARVFPPLASGRFVGGTFGPDDGSVDPSAVTLGYRRTARAMGVEFLQADVTALTVGSDQVTGVRLGDGTEMGAPIVAVCAGAWTPDLLASAGIEIPVTPIMRTVYVVATDVGRGLDMPSAFLPSGVYLIPETEGTYLMAWSRPEDPPGFDFTPADRSRFYDIIWPELVECLPAFDRLEVVRSWAGLYAQNILDANAIIGEWPGTRGLYMATGFSGHGFQQCHAVGRYLSELMVGKEPVLDLSRLGPQRIIDQTPLFEHAGRII
ncbi:MAG: FAD-binding oxidoreductase [Acidimicrobiia bacterium]